MADARNFAEIDSTGSCHFIEQRRFMLASAFERLMLSGGIHFSALNITTELAN